jgi:hypothetical protein
MGQPGFVDLGERYRGLDAKKDPLVFLNAVVPWEDFCAQLSAVWRKPDEERKNAAGRKPWDEIVIFKTLVLQALYRRDASGTVLFTVGFDALLPAESGGAEVQATVEISSERESTYAYDQAA